MLHAFYGRTFLQKRSVKGKGFTISVPMSYEIDVGE